MPNHLPQTSKRDVSSSAILGTVGYFSGGVISPLVGLGGWKDIDNVSMEAELTPEDLSDPVIYNANEFN